MVQPEFEALQAIKTEFVKTLPSIARKQQKVIQETIADCFNDYHYQIIKRIDEDITARKAELDILLVEKGDRSEQNLAEIQSLQNLADTVSKAYDEVESLIAI